MFSGLLRRSAPRNDESVRTQQALARTSQLHAGLAAVQASVSSAGGSFLKTVLNDSSTLDWTTGNDWTPTQAGVSFPISAFIIAIASAAPWPYGRCDPVA